MTSAARRRAHLRVGAATVGVFLVFLLVAVAHGGANASSNVEKVSPPTTEQSTPGQPDQVPPYGYRRGFGRRGFRGGGPPDGGTGGDSSF